ncbi:unnamed protein product [Ectocarpus sp. 13 AM-2016]
MVFGRGYRRGAFCEAILMFNACVFLWILLFVVLVRVFVLLLSSFSLFLCRVALPGHVLIGFRGEETKYHFAGGGFSRLLGFCSFWRRHPPSVRLEILFALRDFDCRVLRRR